MTWTDPGDRLWLVWREGLEGPVLLLGGGRFAQNIQERYGTYMLHTNNDIPGVRGAAEECGYPGGPAMSFLRLQAVVFPADGQPPVADLRVRRAIGLAIDKQRLVDQMTFGTTVPASEDLPSFMWAFEPSAGTARRNLSEAQRLLAEAGWHVGPDGTRRRDGKRLTLGLAFREFHSMPGLLVFVSIVLVGWLMRRVLNHYHLLQVPRTAFLLSLVVVVLIGLTMLANYRSLSATKYVAIFPMVILTGMIERFWTLETEDGTTSSFRTLLCTMAIAATISLACSLHALLAHLFRYPETLGLIMAAQLLIGRYTGYRFMELLRFRDFVKSAALTTPAVRYFDEGAAPA